MLGAIGYTGLAAVPGPGYVVVVVFIVVAVGLLLCTAFGRRT